MGMPLARLQDTLVPLYLLHRYQTEAALKEVGGTAGMIEGNAAQLLIQAEGVGIVLVFDIVASLILYKIVDLLVGLRVTHEEEVDGLDISLHGEVVH